MKVGVRFGGREGRMEGGRERNWRTVAQGLAGLVMVEGQWGEDGCGV